MSYEDDFYKRYKERKQGKSSYADEFYSRYIERKAAKEKARPQPSPLMQGALDMANPLSKNYVDPFTQKASYDWYSQPESKRSDILSHYAQQAAFGTKYDGMSYADRKAALENLKTNLKNAPNPEQGAEYQYLKNNLAQASPFESAQYRADQDAARMQRISDAQGKSGEYDAMKSEFDRDYSSSDYYDLVRRREDAQARGRTDLVKEINDQIDKYRRGRLGTREAELIDYLETHSPQDFNVDEDIARHNSYQRYQSGADNALLSLTTAHDEADLYALALKGAQGSYVTNTEKREAKGADYTERSRSAGTRRRGTHTDEYAYGSHGPKIVTSETSQTFDDTGDAQTNAANFEELAKHLGEETGLNQLRGNHPTVYAQVKDTLEAYVPADPTDPIDLDRGITTFSNYVDEGEWLRFYALLGEGGEQNEQAAVEYMNALKPALAARAEQAKQQMYRDTLKNAPPVLDVALGAAYTGKSIISGIASAPVAFGDELIQYATKGEYDPYTPWNATKINADLLGGATSQAISEDHSGADAFLYNAIKSAIESTAGALAFGKAFTFIMGTSAGATRARELYKEGASQEQILFGSLTAAVNEAAFEYISLDKLLKADPKTLKQYVKQIFVQAGIEGSEEISTDVANTISDALNLGENSDYNRDIQRMLYENPGMSYEEARGKAATKVITDALESGLAGAISGGASFAGYVAPTLAGNVARRATYSSQNNKIGKNISSNYQAEGTVKQGLEADKDSEAYKLAKEIDERQRDSKKVSNKALGELARALDAELSQKSDNALDKAFESRREAANAETIENALKENGATDEEAAELAPLVSKSILGEELTDAEQEKIDNNAAAARYVDEVDTKAGEIAGTAGMQQLALRVNATTRGTGSAKASDRLRESALDKVFETAMRNELKPAKLSDNEIGKANETSYKVSTTGKTTYNGKAVNIDAINEIGDGNALVTLENGETAKLSDIEFADKGEAVAWQTITSIDGISPQAAASLIAQYKNKPANVTAGVWARGIAEGYEIGRSGKLGTKEFPKAEASAKYLSNIGNDARRISETVGRQDARYEQHKEAIEVDRKNVNNKNVNDAADTLDKMGRKYKIVEGIDGDGYIEKDGTIVLNKDAKDPIGFVLKHELTHYAETSKDYDGFVKAVKGSRAFAAWIDKQSLKDGTQLQQEADYLRRLKDRYRRHGVTLTNTEAHREMIANFVGDTLFNENGVGLDGLVNGMNAADRNAVMRFLTKIADFFRKHFTKKGETAYLEHFFSQLQNTATGNVIPLSERFNEKNEDIRWSIPETAERERAQSIKQIERLNETVTHLRDMLKLQRTLTHGTVMTQASVARQADRLMDRWDVYVGKGELTRLLNTFYTTVAQKINQREATWEEVAEAAEPVVDFLLSKQVAETEDESVKNVVDYLKGKAIRLNDIQRAEIKHRYGSITAWQKAIAGTVKLRNDGIVLDSLWQEASELHPDWFDPDVTSDADMPIRLAETAKQLQDSLWMEQELPGEAWEETKRDILYDVYETFFDAAPIQTLADKQAKEMSELKAKAYAKIEQVKDAASTRIQNLKEADRERYERLRRDKNAKIEEVKAEARERRQRERERRKKSQLRAEIKDRISEFNDKLLRPGKNKYVPMEFVRSVAGFLKDIDIGAKPGTKVSEKLAALKVKYDALKNDKYYSAAYNEQIGNLLQTVATEIGDTPLPKMSAYQLELLNNMLRALNHRIEHAVSVDRISKSKNAFEYARELINELNAVDHRAITGTTAGKLLDMQVRPQTMFERFAGFKKNSYWSQLYDALDAAQLRETQLSMEAQQMFTDLLNDRKNYKRLAEGVDIGLTDEDGNPVLISRGMMLSIRRALMNADNTRHIVGGGFTVPDFDLYYKGNTGKAFNKKGKRVFGFAADMADIAHQIGELRETMAEQEAAGESTAETETKIADLESQFNELKDRSNAYAAQLAATIDDQLTMYEQNLLSMADVFFDEWSKDILNEATLAVYGFKKANVEKYFPIKVDNNYTETKFDTFSNDISLENAGFMKDRVMSSKPILLQDITDVISDQIKKVSRYAAYLEVIDDFTRIYNVTLPGSSDSVQDALGKRFAGEEGKKFIKNLLQDIQGGRRGGTVTLFDKARGKLAAATLTLNARVALAQAASFPTAAAELGWAPILKALGKTFKKTDIELIMKYSPLLAYRSWGFSSTEIGDARRIKDIRHKVDSKLRWLTGWITSVDSYTVGHLWYAAEYYVDANNKDLEKGSEKYYEEVAKVFNRTIEKTQPNYTTLQRPELMRTDNALAKQLSMFMTQRLQNVNILYEAFARYDKYKKDFKAGKNGVTREDVIEARKARTRAIESQIVAAATISIIKNITDMLLHSFKKRDDDDDYDLTDVGWNLLDAFCDSLISNVVLGSEAYSFLKSKITGDRYYGISLGGVGAITETVDDVSDFIDATKKAFAGNDMNWNAAKQLGYSMSRLMGIPVQNAVKYVTAISEWVQDAKTDQFNHGNYVGKTGVRLYLAEGRTADAIKEINEQQAKGVDMQSTVRDYYKPMYLEAKKSGNKSLMSDIGNELDKIIKDTGVYKNSADKVLSGWVTQAENDAKEKNK